MSPSWNAAEAPGRGACREVEEAVVEESDHCRAGKEPGGSWDRTEEVVVDRRMAYTGRSMSRGVADEDKDRRADEEGSSD